jgi:hypothetical protein
MKFIMRWAGFSIRKMYPNLETYMNLKSLLPGLTIAFMAVSGVLATDVVIVEPEPVENAGKCDAYGPGFSYNPGTKTCIKIGGSVRIDYGTTRPK